MIRRNIIASLCALVAISVSAHAAEEKRLKAASDYEPMAMFAPLAGKAFRGEGTGPDGKPLIDIAVWQYILGGRALQSTHRLEGGDYGGRTIFFYDEGAKEYVYHYFTTAGFHTTGKIDPTPNGFTAVEQVRGHPTVIEVQSEMIYGADDGVMTTRVVAHHVDKDGRVSLGDEIRYRQIDNPGILYFDEADALFGKRTDVKDAHDKYGDER